MDEPARKRRRTNSPIDRASSPLRQPPQRPSFASPTKASLSRNYPSLVPPRPASAVGLPSRPNSRGNALARGKQERASVFGDTDAQDTSDPATGEDATKAPQITTPRARRVGASGRNIATEGAIEEEEPELPTTPSQQGLEEQDSPRRGVLFSSPTKRPPRAKGPVKQSPLRPKTPPVQQASSTQRVEDGAHDGETESKREPPNSELERRKQEKARLERELTELEAQVTRCNDAITTEQKRQPGEALQSSEQSDLRDLVTMICVSEDETLKPTSVSSLLCSFLPFSTIAIPRPTISQKKKPIPSHKPVELADPLPYLQMFTSLSFSTRLSVPCNKVSPSSNRIHQKHTIDIEGPQKLLTAQVSIVVDAMINQIVAMDILSLSPWAEHDLGSTLRARAKDKDLGNACWSIEAYWNIASKRAQYWHRCETTFAHLINGGAARDSENARPRGKQHAKLSRRSLNRHLGRETLILQDRHVLLKLNWRIGFDWTGEAESQITVEPAFPSVWTDGESAKAFSKVPDTFASILQSKGAFEATRVLTSLLFAQ